MHSKVFEHIKLRHSAGTLKFYESHLGHFTKFAKNQGVITISDVLEETVIDYVSWMRETCSNSTINKRIGIIKRMWKYMGVDFLFLQSIEKLREGKKTFDMIQEKDLLAIRRYVKELPEQYRNNLFYKTLVLILMDTGARINEILNIKKKTST